LDLIRSTLESSNDEIRDEWQDNLQLTMSQQKNLKYDGLFSLSLALWLESFMQPIFLIDFSLLGTSQV